MGGGEREERKNTYLASISKGIEIEFSGYLIHKDLVASITATGIKTNLNPEHLKLKDVKSHSKFETESQFDYTINLESFDDVTNSLKKLLFIDCNSKKISIDLQLECDTSIILKSDLTNITATLRLLTDLDRHSIISCTANLYLESSTDISDKLKGDNLIVE